MALFQMYEVPNDYNAIEANELIYKSFRMQ